MTNSVSYARSQQPQSTNAWVMTGIVVASPSSGQIKAMIPALNSYCDLRIDQIRPIEPESLAVEMPPPQEIPLLVEVSTKSLSGRDYDATLSQNERITAHKLSERRSIMRSVTSIDMKDLSIMVGLASLLGAATNMAFSFVTGSAAPQPAVITITAVGFLCGRFLSARLRSEHHG